MRAKTKTGLIAFLILPAALAAAQAPSGSMMDLLDAVDKLDKLEKSEFNDLIHKARSCARSRDFSCAEQNLSRGTRLANSSKDRQLLSDTQSMIDDEKRLALREEEHRRVQLANAERRAREAQEQADRSALVGMIAGAVTSAAIQLQHERAAQRVLSDQIRAGLNISPSSPSPAPSAAATGNQQRVPQQSSAPAPTRSQNNSTPISAPSGPNTQPITRAPAGPIPQPVAQAGPPPARTAEAGSTLLDSTNRTTKGDLRPMDHCDSPSRAYAIDCQRRVAPTAPSQQPSGPKPGTSNAGGPIALPNLPMQVVPPPLPNINPVPYSEAPVARAPVRGANGESAMGCLNVTSKKSPFDERLVEVAINNRCGERVFVVWCSDGLAYSRERCGQGPRSGYFTHHATIEAGGSKTFEIGPNASYSYNGCKGEMSFGNQGEFRDSGTGQIECLINRNRM